MNDEELLHSLPELVRPMVSDVLGLRAQLTELECEGSDATGLVTATTDAWGGLREIRLHPTARRRLDNLSLGDAVRDAVNAAAAQSRLEYRRVLDTVNVFGIPFGEARADPAAAARRLIDTAARTSPGESPGSRFVAIYLALFALALLAYGTYGWITSSGPATPARSWAPAWSCSA